MSTIRIEQYRSGICTPEKHKKILRALGFGKREQIRELPDCAAVRGMVAKIPHIVRILEK